MDAPIAGYYYKEQLTKGEEPDRASFFRTEKIIRTAYEKGRKKFLVKYLHYPSKFNRWVFEDDMLK